jgi:NAD(P)-dependent dehydrogenase (short-subunit alcohol dehydrogenase family)
MDRRNRIVDSKFDLAGRVAVITGGAGLLGYQHARAIAGAGGIPVLADLCGPFAQEKAECIQEEFGVDALGYGTDITREGEVRQLLDEVLRRWGRVDILVNNAANNPKVEDPSQVKFTRFENFPLDIWQKDVDVGLTGAFLCSKIIGNEMARRQRGVIVNVASDLALIAPDQRLYRRDDLPDHLQPVKPVTYSIVKSHYWD